VNADVTWAGEPATCRCRRVIVPTLAETLGCPCGWWLAPGIGWVHTLPGRPA
jgi:hypothetical protein